jgi:type IV conjugative transfer system protein TraL
MENENRLLNRLDQPLRFLGVNKDEAFAFMGPIMMGFFAGYPASGFMAAVGSLSLYRSFKKRNEGSALIHALYWHFPTSQKALKLYVPSHVREYIG